MKIKYLQKELVFSKENYGKMSGCQTFSYSKTVPGENLLSVTPGSLRTLCSLCTVPCRPNTQAWNNNKIN